MVPGPSGCANITPVLRRVVAFHLPLRRDAEHLVTRCPSIATEVTERPLPRRRIFGSTSHSTRRPDERRRKDPQSA